MNSRTLGFYYPIEYRPALVDDSQLPNVLPIRRTDDILRLNVTVRNRS